MTLLAIDPGPTESAYVLWNGVRILGKGKISNYQMLDTIRVTPYMSSADALVLEMIACYGMAVGAEVFETCVWIGRFMERFDRGPHAHRVTRGEVKMHLCRSMKAKDANVRQALIDRFGGPSAIGKKASPGPLHGVSGDVWAALAVAVTWWDKYEFRKAAKA